MSHLEAQVREWVEQVGVDGMVLEYQECLNRGDGKTGATDDGLGTTGTWRTGPGTTGAWPQDSLPLQMEVEEQVPLRAEDEPAE